MDLENQTLNQLSGRVSMSSGSRFCQCCRRGVRIRKLSASNHGGNTKKKKTPCDDETAEEGGADEMAD